MAGRATCPLLGPDDMLIITADHGNDPTFKGTDHTREYRAAARLPARRSPAEDLGIRNGFYDIAQSARPVLSAFRAIPRGRQFFLISPRTDRTNACFPSGSSRRSATGTS